MNSTAGFDANKMPSQMDVILWCHEQDWVGLYGIGMDINGWVR